MGPALKNIFELKANFEMEEKSLLRAFALSFIPLTIFFALIFSSLGKLLI